MNRLTNATRVIDLFGPGKDGYGNGVPGSVPPTILDSQAMNPIQEEIARAIEARGETLDSGNLGQLGDVLLHLTQNIDRVNAEEPVLSSLQSAHDHPGNPNNRWKLQFHFPLSQGGVVRFFSGEGDFGDGSCWAITLNAAWNPAPGPTWSKWNKDDSGKESNILRAVFGQLHWLGREPGPDMWQDDQWQARGNLKVGDTLEPRAIAADTATIRSFRVSGDGLSTNIDDDMAIGGSCTVGADLTVGDDIDVGDRYLYSTPKARSTQLFPEGGFNLGLGRTRLHPFESGIWRIKLPQDAVITGVWAKFEEYTNCTYEVSLYKSGPVNFMDTSSVPSVPVFTDNHGPGGTGVIVTKPKAGLNVQVNNQNEHYWVHIHCGSTSPADVDVLAVAVVWTDPGPRND